MSTLKIGMVGLDTSHVTAFANLLHDSSNPHYVPGARITVAYPGGSPDFDISINRVEGFTNDLRDKHDVAIAQSIAELKGQCDAIFLESVDGRIHLSQFREIADWGVPVFIDKPLTISSSEAREIAALAKANGTRVMSASAIRYGQRLQEALADDTLGAITGGDFFGPMKLIDVLPGFFWYGIHTIEMLYATLGTGCCEVAVTRSGPNDLILAQWADGRIATARGHRTGNGQFGGTIHREKGSQAVNDSTSPKPYYAGLLENVVAFLNGADVLDLSESVEVIRFLEAANESVANGGQPVAL